MRSASNIKLPDLFSMNDWEVKKFITTVLAIQLVFVGLVCAEAFGLKVPVARQVVGFVYLTFIPGYLILRILKIHNLGGIESLLYAVGLSLSSLMFLGLFANAVYPIFGILRPISLCPLTITIITFVSGLCILSYLRDKDYADSGHIELKSLVSPFTLFLLLIPLIAVLGACLVNFYQNSFLLMILLFILGILPFLVTLDIFEEHLYPLVVFVTAISLLYHNSLFSLNLVEWADTSFEYWFAKLVLENSLWNPAVESCYNGVISVTLLAPIFSYLLDLPLTYVFKIAYPLLFAFVPLCLYQVYLRLFGKKVAFLATFFMMSMFNFYTDMLGLARQQIAELFFALLILLFINNKRIKAIEKASLLVLFCLSLVVSHYSLSYLTLLIFIFTWLASLLIKRNDFPSATFMAFFAVSMLAWYMYVSGSTSFGDAVRIGTHILNSLTSELLNPEACQGLQYLIMGHRTIVGYLHKVVHIISWLFIGIGLLTSVLNKKSKISSSFYYTISLAFFGVAIATIAVPYFAETLNTSRMYGITLLILSPFCVMGGETLLKKLKSFTKISWRKLLPLFFAVYLLFNSGLVYQFSSDQPFSQSLNPNIRLRPSFCDQEVTATAWLKYALPSQGIRVYADQYYSCLIQMELGSFNPLLKTDSESYKLPSNSYIFLGKGNVKEGTVWLSIDPAKPRWKKEVIPYENSPLFNTVCLASKVYDGGGVEIYLFDVTS